MSEAARLAPATIAPRPCLKELFPRLAERHPRPDLFHEVKSNKTRAEVETMARGGVAMIQPGIESLATDPLRMMRRGLSAHQDVALLRDCAATGIRVAWGIIYRFPGARAARTGRLADPPWLRHRL